MNRILTLALSLVMVTCVFAGCRRNMDEAVKDTTTGTTVDSARTAPAPSMMPSMEPSRPSTDASTPSVAPSMPTTDASRPSTDPTTSGFTTPATQETGTPRYSGRNHR